MRIILRKILTFLEPENARKVLKDEGPERPLAEAARNCSAGGRPADHEKSRAGRRECFPSVVWCFHTCTCNALQFVFV